MRGRPRKQVQGDGLRVLQRCLTMGLKLKPLKLSKKLVLNHEQQVNLLLNGGCPDLTKLEPGRIKIDYPKYVGPEHAESVAGRLFSRGFITHDMYEALEDFGKLYRKAFPRMTLRTPDGERVHVRAPRDPISCAAAEKYLELCDYFRANEKYYALGHLITTTHHDPAWLDAEKEEWGGLGEYKVKAPVNFGHEHRNLIYAIGTYIELMRMRRAA